MEQSKDYIEREIQKLTSLFMMLLKNVREMKAKNLNTGIQEIDKVFVAEFNLSFREMYLLENVDLITRIDHLRGFHIEKFAELIYQIIKKNDNEIIKFDNKKLANKAILMLDHVNKDSKVFSFQRIELKGKLQTLT